MTGDELKRQVMARVAVPVGQLAMVNDVLDRWVGHYPRAFKFGPASVLAAVRLVQREMQADDERLRRAAARAVATPEM